MIWRILLTLIAGLGVYGGAQLSLSHMQTGETCPMFGPLPACYLVLAGYVLMLAAAWLPGRLRHFAFWPGWLPVFGLALVGSGFELIEGDICPKSAGGIPQCYFSLAMTVAALVFFLRLRSREPGV
jgi:hypothetical protein